MVGAMSVSVNSSSPVDQVYEHGNQHANLLSATNDEHGGVILDMEEPMDAEVFQGMLRDSILQWKQQGKKGVWINLPIGLVNLVETLIKEGFWYHHAEPNYLMLVYWIPETVSTIPANASHRVRVGAVVVTDKRELLVVQEKCGKLRGTGVWKIPTGVVDEGEDLFNAAVREVKEETGVDTKFQEILAFRQTHRSFFVKSDLFFLCMLCPLSFDIQKQESEIEAAKWMPFEDYAAQPFTQAHEIYKYIADLCKAKMDRVYAGFTPQSITSAFNKDQTYLYLNTKDFNQSCSTDRL